MIARRLRKRRLEWTAAALGCAAALLLALAAAYLAHVHNSQMQALRAQAAQTRAQLMAQSIGQRLAHAVAGGIPLQQLVGVPQFLDRWHALHPDIAYIAVDDTAGRVLWQSPDGAAPAQASGIGQADVAAAGMAQARVRLHLRQASVRGLGRMLGQLVPAVLLVCTLAWLGARFACAQGPWLRNHGVRLMARWAMRGDYRQLLFLPQRKPFDLRVQDLAQAMHRMHERVARMRLLIGSLRRTEPQQLRRDYLDQVLQEAEGHDRFAETPPGSVRLVAVQSQSLWMALLLCLGAVGPLTPALRLAAQTADSQGPWQQALPAACLGALLLAAAAGWQLAVRLRIATLSVLILSLVALALPPLAMLLGGDLHPGAIAAWNGCFAGAALAACTRAQSHPDRHPGFAHAQPPRPGAALLAWWGGLLWLAPVLGHYAQAALRPPWALLALLLPMACGLWFALRWDVVHSPWRVRMAAALAPPHAGPSAHEWALGIAAGLVAGPLLLAVAVAAPETATLWHSCALGIGLALGWAVKCQTVARWRAVALAAAMLQLTPWLVAPFLPLPWLAWLPGLATLACLLLGMLLAHRLAEVAQAPQEAVSQRLLLACALGAGLSALASAWGLQGGLALLALALVAPWRGARAKGSDVP
ncbi:MAG: hypothetical protein ABWY08_04230 [Comamonas sp.]